MRLIDPKMSIDTIKSYIEVWDCKGCLPYGETQHNVMAVDDLQYFPTIEAEPVRHGRWIFGHSRTSSWMVCSICRKSQSGQTACFSFCPNCGARMDGGYHSACD
jgi:hypothetical protein